MEINSVCGRAEVKVSFGTSNRTEEDIQLGSQAVAQRAGLGFVHHRLHNRRRRAGIQEDRQRVNLCQMTKDQVANDQRMSKSQAPINIGWPSIAQLSFGPWPGTFACHSKVSVKGSAPSGPRATLATLAE